MFSFDSTFNFSFFQAHSRIEFRFTAHTLALVSCKLTFNFSQVWPPKSSSVEDSQRKLDNLLESGDVNKAMQIAFSVLSAAGDLVSCNLTRSSER